MTILEMFEREDIYDIIEKTMSEYYKTIDNKKVNVKINKNHFGKRWLIYPRLGIIVSRTPSWKVIKRTYVSFDVQGNLPKKLFAWTYITLCFLTFGLLADASMELSDYSIINKDIVIIPSNRKIRIYDYKNMYVDSILKHGFNDFYLRKEIEVRKKPHFDFILPVIDYGEKWYREELLQGRCLVRTSGDEYDRYIKDVIEDLKEFYNDNSSFVDAKKYGRDLIEKYTDMLENIIKTKHIKCGSKIRNVLNQMDLFLNNIEAEIELVLGHGDLQTGNIYVDEKNKKAYIIDWETVKYRSIWYDAATVMCSTRRKDKFSTMINTINNKSIIEKINTFSNNKICNNSLVASILILEELGFFLEEIIDLPDDMGSEIIERYEYEIDHINFNKLFAGGNKS